MTELDEILELVVEQVDGALAAAVAGMDGLLVERYPAGGEDMSALAAELTNVLNAARAAMGGRIEGGELQELIIGCERRVGYVRLLSDNLFCLILMEADGNLGKARIYAAKAARSLVEVLS